MNAIPQRFYSLNPTLVIERMTTKEFRLALMDCPFISKGKPWDLRGTRVGPGVYDVRAVPWKSPEDK